MTHTPAPELDAETMQAAAARVAAMNLSDPKPSNEKLAEKYIAESGKTVHASDCSTSVAPAEVPGPYDCDVQPTPTHDKPGAPSMQAINSILGRERKPRSDKGVQRGPKAPGEPEAAATVETTALTVELTAVQYADLEREAARVYRDIEPRYLTTEPAVVLLNSRVQKHWRILVGK